MLADMPRYEYNKGKDSGKINVKAETADDLKSYINSVK
jgi:hypothetical protein